MKSIERKIAALPVDLVKPSGSEPWIVFEEQQILTLDRFAREHSFEREVSIGYRS